MEVMEVMTRLGTTAELYLPIGVSAAGSRLRNANRHWVLLGTTRYCSALLDTTEYLLPT